MFLFAGPGVRPGGRAVTRDIVDVLPTLLALAGALVPTGLDGQAMADLLTVPVEMSPDTLTDESPPKPYGGDAEAAVAARLAALGYLEPAP